MTRRVSEWVASQAAVLGVDTDQLRGTGVGGSVTVADVVAASHRERAGAEAVTASLADLRARAPRAGSTGRSRPGEVGSLTASGSGPIEPWLLAENAAADAPREVRLLADRRGVRLSAVTGTGPSGAITRRDVEAVADREHRERARAWQAAQPVAPVEPRVTFTASGLPVSALTEVPAPVRRALAAASTHAEAFALVERYPRHLSDDEAAERLASDRSVSVRYGGAAPVAWPS